MNSKTRHKHEELKCFTNLTHIMCAITISVHNHTPNQLIRTLNTNLNHHFLSNKQTRNKLYSPRKKNGFFYSITLLILFSPIFLQHVLAQIPGTTTTTCASRLLSLAPCGPFVQGFVQLPAQQCSDGLNQIYSQEPACLCLFLNNTSTLSPAFPINQTVALQLPPLCDIPANSSTCSSSSSSSPGGEAPIVSSSIAPPPSTSTGSHQLSPGAKNKSRVAATPVAPRPTSFMGLGYGLKSSSSKSEIIIALAVILPITLLII